MTAPSPAGLLAPNQRPFVRNAQLISSNPDVWLAEFNDTHKGTGKVWHLCLIKRHPNPNRDFMIFGQSRIINQGGWRKGMHAAVIWRGSPDPNGRDTTMEIYAHDIQPVIDFLHRNATAFAG